MADRDDRLSGEDRLIARFFKPLATHPGAFGLVRRCRLHHAAARLRSGAQDRCDHRRRAFLSRRSAAHTSRSKALRVNLSDLAAKGAKPARLSAVARVAEGDRRRLACRFRRRPGGDAELLAARCSAATPTARRGRSRFRSRCSARVPHGTHGAPRRRASRATACSSAARSAMRRSGCSCATAAASAGSSTQRSAQHLLSRYLLPQPRNALAEPCATHASAAMDVSDGLAGDLAKLCRASRCRG